jgi:hypothetical protein
MTDNSHEDLRTFTAISRFILLRIVDYFYFRQNLYDTKTHFMFNPPTPENRVVYTTKKNMVQADRLQIIRNSHALCIQDKLRKNTDTPSEYYIYIYILLSSATVITQTHLSTTLRVHFFFVLYIEYVW